MKHARRDYQDRIVDLEEKIPADEPVFLIRGQDIVAPMILRQYARAAEDQGATPELVRTVYEHAARMEDWQQHVHKKVPDAPKHALAPMPPFGDPTMERDRYGIPMRPPLGSNEAPPTMPPPNPPGSLGDRLTEEAQAVKDGLKGGGA